MEQVYLGPQDNRSYFKRSESRADEYRVVLSHVQCRRPFAELGLKFVPCLSSFKGTTWSRQSISANLETVRNQLQAAAAPFSSSAGGYPEVSGYHHFLPKAALLVKAV